MSVGFRILILMLLGFGAIWAYRFRGAELDWLLRQPAPRLTEDGVNYSSPVREFLDPGDRAIGWASRTEEPDLQNRWQEMGEEREEEIVEDPWVVDSPPADDSPGLDEEGGVEGEEVPVPTPPDTEPVQRHREIKHKARKGDTLWKLAEEFLGAGYRYPEIAKLNTAILKNGETLLEGAEVTIRIPISEKKPLKKPPADVDTDVEGNSMEDPVVPESGGGEVKGSHSASGSVVLHRVKEKENLTTIAQQYFPEDSQGWRRIYAGNRDKLSSPDWIRQGMILKIPSSGGAE